MIKIFATLCRLASPFDCHDELVTNSNFAELSITGCLAGAPQLADWMKQKPAYRLGGWRCEIGERAKREQT